MSDIAIKVEGLGKKYLVRRHQQRRSRFKSLRDLLTVKARSQLRLGRYNGQSNGTCEESWELKGVSFEIKTGEAVSVISRNGVGKSTLPELLSRITEPATERFAVEASRV